MKKLFENWNKFINEMEVSGGNLPARQGQKTDVEVLLNDIENASDELDYSASSAPIDASLFGAVKRVLSEYTDEVPPDLQEMIDLILDRDYDTIRSEFNRMWTDLGRYHRNKRIPMTPRVSHNFRIIDTIVRNM
jgi:hypothetical protein